MCGWNGGAGTRGASSVEHAAAVPPPTAAALVAALLLSGCSSRPERADTVSPAPQTTAEPTQAATESPPAPVAEAVALTQAQIEEALLTADDVPTG